jgi:tetratricopeptide (TPR) repeat protein
MADTWILISQYGNVPKIKAAQKAQTMIEKALEVDPESAEGFAALGLARWEIGQMDAAESALRHAVDLNENYIPAQLWLAGVLGQQGRYPEQSMVLEQAMARDPLNELLLVNFAGNLSIRGEWERGKNMMQELLALKPDSTILLRFMAKMELHNGNLVAGWKLANRAYQIQPENPEDIASLARTLVLLDELEEAERLLLDGLKIAENNANLQAAYWLVLLVSRRYEEAEGVIREKIDEMGEDIPEIVRREFDSQLGLLAMIRGDFAAARQHLASAVGDESDPAWSGEQTKLVTLAALAYQRTGDAGSAQSLLQRAERSIRRARLNGVDDQDIYYSESVLLSMRNDVPAALQKLQTAYEKGFRERWVFEIDGRLDPLRGEQEFLLVQQRINEDLNHARTEIRSLALAKL